MRADDVEPTRLDAAISAMRLFLDRLPKRFKVGLVAFSSEPEVLAEPTRDRAAVRDALGYLQPEAGTAIGDGLEVGGETGCGLACERRRRAQDQCRAFPPLSCCSRTGLRTAAGSSRCRRAQHAREARDQASTPSRSGRRTAVVSFGFGLFVNSIPVPPDPPTMRAIARATGGKTYTAESSTKLSSVYKTLGSSIGRRTELREITSWFAAASALFLIGALAAGRVWEGRLP